MSKTAPLRAVIGLTDLVLTGPVSGETITIPFALERLECGHTVRAKNDLHGRPTCPARRRCKKCEKQ